MNVFFVLMDNQSGKVVRDLISRERQVCRNNIVRIRMRRIKVRASARNNMHAMINERWNALSVS